MYGEKDGESGGLFLPSREWGGGGVYILESGKNLRHTCYTEVARPMPPNETIYLWVHTYPAKQADVLHNIQVGLRPSAGILRPCLNEAYGKGTEKKNLPSNASRQYTFCIFINCT